MENPSLPHYHGEEPAHTEVVRQMLEKEDTFQELSDIFRAAGRRQPHPHLLAAVPL